MNYSLLLLLDYFVVFSHIFVRIKCHNILLCFMCVLPFYLYWRRHVCKWFSQSLKYSLFMHSNASYVLYIHRFFIGFLAMHSLLSVVCLDAIPPKPHIQRQHLSNQYYLAVDSNGLFKSIYPVIALYGRQCRPLVIRL